MYLIRTTLRSTAEGLALQYSIVLIGCPKELHCHAHLPLQCRGLHKQLAHSSALRTKLAQDLDTARDALQQLQVKDRAFLFCTSCFVYLGAESLSF